MPTNYGQTVLGAWNQAASTHYQTTLAQNQARENRDQEYNDVASELITRGVLRTDNGIYMDIDKINELNEGGLANLVDFAFEGTALTKYTGLDDKLKKGKVSSVKKVTEENYERLGFKSEDVGKYAIGTKDERGIMRFIGRGRREGDDTPVLFESEDLSKMLDIAAQRILSKTTYGDRVAYATAASQKATSDLGRRIEDTAQSRYDEAGRGGQDREDQIKQKLQEVIEDSMNREDPDAPSDTSATVAAGLSQVSVNSNNADKVLTADKETITRRGQSFETVDTSATEDTKEEAPQYSDPDKIIDTREKWLGHHVEKGLEEANKIMGTDDATNIQKDLFGATHAPTTHAAKKVFDHLKEQGVTVIDENTGEERPLRSKQPQHADWAKVQEVLTGMKGAPETSATEPVAEDSSVNTPVVTEVLTKVTDNAETPKEAVATINEKIAKKEPPEPEAVKILKEMLEANEVKTLDDYRDIVAKELSPQDLIAANWIIASIGTESGADMRDNMTMLTNITATGFPDYSYEAMMDDKNTAYANVTTRMNAMSSAAGKAMSNTARQNQFLKDIEPGYALRRDFTLDMESGKLSNADGDVINRDQHRQIMSLTIENLRRSLNNGAYGPRGSADYIAATKEIDKQTARFIQHAAAQQEGVGRTGDKIKDFFINPDTPFYVDGGLKNLRIKNTRRGPMFVYGTSNYKGDFDETDNSVLAGGIIATVFGSDAEFMKFINRNQIRDAETGAVWTRSKPKKK